MTVEHYERSFEQNEFLGLNDMKTVNYTTKDAWRTHSAFSDDCEWNVTSVVSSTALSSVMMLPKNTVREVCQILLE